MVDFTNAIEELNNYKGSENTKNIKLTYQPKLNIIKASKFNK